MKDVPKNSHFLLLSSQVVRQQALNLPFRWFESNLSSQENKEKIHLCFLEKEKNYKPTCPRGYSDCVCDPAYIKFYHPEWYKDLYGDLTPQQASKKDCLQRVKGRS